MAIDTPARIAIIGGGPIGLEAALYARYLGYQVAVYEQGRVADSVRRWGHVRMFSPFSLNSSNLGLATLAAQDPAYRPPASDQYLTGNGWYEKYLRPLSRCDLLVDEICEQTSVVAVGRESLLKSDLPGDEDRGEQPFRLLLRDADGDERIAHADVVIDASGTFARPNWLGASGIPAIGELSCRGRIEYGLPDVSGSDRERYAGRITLVVGGGHSAATTVVALSELAASDPATEITWITRRDPDDAVGPVARIGNDRLPERQKLVDRANQLARSDAGPISHFAGTSVLDVSFHPSNERFAVRFSGLNEFSAEFDNVIANVGGRPDVDIFRELQVHQCYVSEGPMKLAAALLGGTSADCLDQTSHGAQTLLNPEPHFYILGAKSYGRNSNFLFSVGLQQIRELFTVIGDRENLDIYSSVINLLP